jgi:hypothetical protein
MTYGKGIHRAIFSGRNPRNERSTLFKRLTRIFSGPLTNYRRETEKALKTKQLSKYQRWFKSAHGQEFKKSNYNPFENLQSMLMMQHGRTRRYSDFDQMEFDPILCSALDIYADEITTSSKLAPLLSIQCPNQEIREILKVLYFDILNIEFNLYGWTRNLCKYGDFFLYLDIDENSGVKNVMGLPPAEVERMEGQDTSNPGYVQFQFNTGQMTLESWQIGHFRILGNDKFCPYGQSVLDPARRIFRQLCLIEDSVMAYRIVRCLHGDTKIWTESGHKDARNIRVGDKVYTYNKNDGTLSLSEVTDWVNNGKQQIWEVVAGSHSLKANFNHPLLAFDIRTNRTEYVTVENLSQEHHLLATVNDGSVAFENIYKIVKTTEFEDVFDVRVASDNHNFIADGIVSHNSPERRVFYIDVGNIPPDEVEAYIEKIKTQMKREQIVDPDSGQVDLRYSAMSVETDYYIPTRGNSSTKIENLPGGHYTGDIDDVKYLRDKLFSAIKIPASYLSRDEGAGEDRESLCLRMDAKIPLLDGRSLSLKDIIEKYNAGELMYAYSMNVDNLSVIPGKIKWAGITQNNASNLLRVWFDNEQYLDCTPNHELVMRSGLKKRADELVVNEPVMGPKENHKIVKIEKLNICEDVGCLTIDNEYHNFAIESGVFVGNSQKDLRFARTIQRIQRSVTSELEKIGLIHLYILGYRNEDLLSFELSLNNPSKIAELQELEHWKTKFDVASSATDGYFSRRWISQHLFNLTEEEFLRNQRELYYDANFNAQIEKITTPQDMEGGAGGGGDLGMGEPSPESTELAPPQEKQDESPLLVTPGAGSLTDSEKPHLTTGAKGHWYTSEDNDKRSIGARARSYFASGGGSAASPSRRNLFKGYPREGKLTNKLLTEGESIIDAEYEVILDELKKDV